MTLSDSQFMDALSPLTGAMEACGFEVADGPQPTWLRIGEDVINKVVLWRHPRRLSTLQGYVASTNHGAMVHLRLFDPDWQPERLLPGSVDKGWDFEDAESLSELASQLAGSIWPRAIGWFEAPVDAEELLMMHGRVPSVIRPGPLLDYHRRRANWLREHEKHREAEYVEQMVDEIEALYASVESQE